ncbi:MAG TPA: hypothetical protein VMX56_02895 [Anaerolineales bacterium]|nr:hypothetical protein [Anaerolineales bacterium]
MRDLPYRGPAREVRFYPERTGVLYFSRGRGRGHAIPDISIVEELNRLRDDLDILFVSYATGADTLIEFGQAVIDLGLPENNLVWDTTVLAGRLISALRPALVVAHEEFAALVATSTLGIPAILITHWFLEPETFVMQALRHADDIIFIDRAGRFEEPPTAAGKVHYVGPVVRDFDYDRSDRDRCRIELGMSVDETLITVLPGSWTEAMAPIFDLVLEAIRLLRIPKVKLIWVAGEDYQALSSQTESLEWVSVIEKEWQIDRLMVASDIVITKANRNTVVELEHLGIPSISLTYRLNPMDDQSIAGIRTNTPLEAAALRPEQLAERLRMVMDGDLDGDIALSDEGANAGGRRSAAAAAADIIHRRLQHTLDSTSEGREVGPEQSLTSSLS